LFSLLSLTSHSLSKIDSAIEFPMCSDFDKKKESYNLNIGYFVVLGLWEYKYNSTNEDCDCESPEYVTIELVWDCIFPITHYDVIVTNTW